MRERGCTDPKHNGRICTGNYNQSEACGDSPCPVDGYWLDWDDWSVCSVTCGGGSQTRSRTCNEPQHGGKPCNGSALDTQSCSTLSCPVDGTWQSWMAWDTCSATCGGGTTKRSRHCNQPKFNGKLCSGNAEENDTCNNFPCPVDGSWKSWGEWALCDKTCGGGQQTRTRECKTPEHGGQNCHGNSSDIQQCNENPCPENGVWLEWDDWEACNTTCGVGSQRRSRLCDGPRYGGNNCEGDTDERRTCNDRECPVDGYWLTWEQWAQCSASCGGGKQERSRDCQPGLHGGKNCTTGESSEQQDCNEFACPIDGTWAMWSSWGKCTESCGSGIRIRDRVCSGFSNGGKACEGIPKSIQNCNTHSCPVNGTYESWSSWEPCNVTCGGGMQWRYRNCTEPLHGGEDCNGPASDRHACGDEPCPEDGILSEWEEWSDCSVTCGSGIRNRSRTCTPPLYGGKACEGALSIIENCSEVHCPVDGVFSEWGVWGTCSRTCGNGSQVRTRTCTTPEHGGADCVGDLQESRVCTTDIACPVHGELLPWSSWEPCTVTCNGGISRRTRGCTEPKYGGKVCEGTRVDEQVCGETPCPVDGEFKEWEAWSTCPVTCNGGTQRRTRECIPPQHGGNDCDGNATESQKCGETPCPVNGYFTEWELWTACTVSCSGGTQTRTRQCVPPEHGGLECDGASTDSQACGEDPCPVDGHWNEWETWSSCPVTCGGGVRNRTRECIGRKYGGKDCDGSTDDSTDCAKNQCPIPGDWKDWAKWSQCSVSCEGGTRIRIRECDTKTHGELTAPCEGHDKETGNCNQFDCFPYENTCTGWVKRGLEDNQVVFVNPKRKGPFEIMCDVEQENGIGVGIIGHDREKSKKIHGYEGAGEYSIEINYNVTLRQAAAFVDVSKNCRQFLQWRCKGSLIHNPNNNGQTTFFMNRTHGVADYMGGGEPGSNSCACGMTQTCVEPELKCNCDKNDDVWREDSGFVTVKRDLPITGFAAGDTGKARFKEDDEVEIGEVLIGFLICSSEDPVEVMLMD